MSKYVKLSLTVEVPDELDEPIIKLGQMIAIKELGATEDEANALTLEDAVVTIFNDPNAIQRVSRVGLPWTVHGVLDDPIYPERLTSDENEGDNE